MRNKIPDKPEADTDPIFAVLADFVEKQDAQRSIQDACACRQLSPQDEEACRINGSFIAAYARLVQTRPTSFLGARDLLDWAIQELEEFHQLDHGATLWPALYLVRQFLESRVEEQQTAQAVNH
jgi:hypothetical protein